MGGKVGRKEKNDLDNINCIGYGTVWVLVMRMMVGVVMTMIMIIIIIIIINRML